MGNTESAVRRALAERNGGPGLTARELGDTLGVPLPAMRTTLAAVVFARDGGVTCVAESKRSEARYVLGDSAALRQVSA